jgi:hypothetical protein
VSEDAEIGSASAAATSGAPITGSEAIDAARWRTCHSSRTFPGHECDRSMGRTPWPMATTRPAPRS